MIVRVLPHSQDLLSSFPWDFIALAAEAPPPVIFGLGMLRPLLRVRVIMSVFARLELDVHTNYTMIRAVKFLFVISFEAHLCAFSPPLHDPLTLRSSSGVCICFR